MRSTSAGTPSTRQMATRCSSPPESVCTSWSMMPSKFIGLMTSELNWGCMNMALIRLRRSMRTVPGNLGETGRRYSLVWGFIDTRSETWSASLSGLSLPPRSWTRVVLPMPFSPRRTMISESENWPDLTCSLKPPSVLVMFGYVRVRMLGAAVSSTVSAMRNVSDSSRKRRFSVGIMPSRKMLMPSRTE
ncbi:hypothetical protein CC85DRAFT_241756 [Cutaneotrichosporon oleaginosum]|uniref:Uncharacterized protein n=1 Tax=Cutaneotrichosporon oleaginosum TaxID=879819 RepID=A0A0J1BAK7_9TREE|nr:uncharacterized protein CC85DRAFT_241756 [Cutaneotrichosporon oleaginosum]KLT44934.1 hypothetical protein CC85DRAFT_241756 [Cutaneotrichosporon oleaginosum]